MEGRAGHREGAQAAPGLRGKEGGQAGGAAEPGGAVSAGRRQLPGADTPSPPRSQQPCLAAGLRACLLT